MLSLIALQQADSLLLDHVARIATAQTILMIAIVILVGLAVAGAILSYTTMKTLGRTLKSLEKVINELAPRAEPLLDGATRVAVDAAAITESVRRRLNDILDTVEDVNGRLRTVTDAAEQRVRNFGAVMDVVQGEAEDMLLGAASTARGIHTTARALREPPPDRRLTHTPAPPDEGIEESHG
jgi:uncharacterized protein YoxC